MDYMAKLRSEAKRLGATITKEEGKDTSLIVDAPRFKTWSSTGNHGVYSFCYGRGKKETQFAAANALRDMEMGLTDCDIPNCDFCNPVVE